MIAWHATDGGHEALIRVATRQTAKRDFLDLLLAEGIRARLNSVCESRTIAILVVFDAYCTSACMVAPTHSHDFGNERVHPRCNDANTVSIARMHADSRWMDVRVVRELECDKDREHGIDG